jgi:hypothetical protein
MDLPKAKGLVSVVANLLMLAFAEQTSNAGCPRYRPRCSSARKSRLPSDRPHDCYSRFNPIELRAKSDPRSKSTQRMTRTCRSFRRTIALPSGARELVVKRKIGADSTGKRHNEVGRGATAPNNDVDPDSNPDNNLTQKHHPPCAP